MWRWWRMMTLQQIARALGGEVSGGQLRAPGPGHSTGDRSLSVRLDPDAPDGFLVNSFAGDDPIRCKDYVRKMLGLPPWRPQRCGVHGYARANGVEGHHQHLHRVHNGVGEDHVAQQRQKAQRLWGLREPLAASPAEVYLRQVRGYGGPLMATLGFLPPSRSDHHPALIAAFGIADEIEPGVITIDHGRVQGVHLTFVRPNGSGKAGTGRDKIMIGPSSGWPIVIAPPSESLGLSITEGIEDALTVYEATGLGAWACGSANRLPTLAFVMPDYVECVTIYAHDDEAGRRGAHDLADALVRRCIEVFLEGAP